VTISDQLKACVISLCYALLINDTYIQHTGRCEEAMKLHKSLCTEIGKERVTISFAGALEDN